MNLRARSSLIAAFSLSILLTPLAHGQSAIVHQISLPTGMTWCDDSMINGLFSQINAFRSQKGVSTLGVSTLGMKDAELRAAQFAQYMATANPSDPNFDPHQGWDTTAAGLGYNVVSENLAFITSDPAYIVGGVWQDSLHLAAMLTTKANVAGVSCVNYNDYPYWTYEPGSCSDASCSSTSTPAPPPSSGGTTTTTLDSEEWAFLTLINNYRVQNGLGALQVSATLESSSRWMSGDMAANNYFSHTDSLGRTPGVRIAAFGYNYTPWGENLAAGYSAAQDVFNGWLTACDPDASGNCTYAHRQNMLAPGFAAIGIARAYGSSSSYGWYWTTDFGGYVDQAVPAPGSTPPSSTSAPTITAFTATPSSIAAGQSSNLSWTITGATTVTIDNGIGTVSASGSQSITPAQTTTYTLTAGNSAGNTVSTVTVTVAVAPPASDTTPPTPSSLTSAAARSATEVDLSWSASTDNVGVAGYQILRNGAAIASVGAATLSYADTRVGPAATYAYTVKAFDAAGNYSTASNSVQATTPAASISGACPAPASGAFTGCYFNNLMLSGTPVFARTDSQINFDWLTTPDPALPAGPFSVRWAGDFTFAAGAYKFTATVSDGMRVYIDGGLVLDQWYDQPTAIYAAQRTLSAGIHRITVEYYNNTGQATAHLTWQNSSPVTLAPAILSFSANPSAITAGQTVTLLWSVNGASSVTIDNQVGDVTGLSSKNVQPSQTTTYTLTASNSVGTVTAHVTVSLAAASDTQPPSIPALTSAVAKTPTEVDLAWSAAIDNVGVAGYRILRNSSPLKTVSGSTLAYADTSAAANTTYTYSVQAFDAAGNYSAASNQVSVATPAAPVSGATCGVASVGAFTGCFYRGTNLIGAPVLTTTDAQINFDWGTGSPASSVPPANFSARWQGYFDFDFAMYSFVTQASDGIRVYVDGRLVIDDWQDHPVTTDQASTWMTPGSHLITVEYYAWTGFASCHLTWQK